MSYNTILATAPLTATGYHLKATGTALGQSLIWDNGTNVGIGNTNTSYTLDVSGTGRFTGALTSLQSNISSLSSSYGTWNGTTSGAGFLALQYNGSTYGWIGQGSAIVTSGSNTDLAISYQNNLVFSQGAGAERMRITSAGNVGIGGSTFTFAATGRTNLVLNGSTDSLFEFQNGGSASAYLFSNSSNLEINAVSTRDMQFVTNAVIRMRITSGGNVGVGISGVYSDVRLMSRGASATASDYSFRAENSTGGNLFFARNDGLLNTGLAAQSPYNLTIAASANCHIYSDGVLFRATSSKRYKTDIEDLSVNTFELINKIRPVWYRSLCERDKKDWSWYGFIAEELAEIDPRFVQFGYASEDYIKDEITNETKLKENAELRADGVMYDRLTVLLIKGMQEQQAQIEAQDAKIEELKALIAAK